MLSGKKKICQNGQIIYENNSYQGAFNFNFTIGKNSLSVVQHGDKFELRVNNQAFSHLYENKLTNQHFKTDDEAGYGGGAGGSRSYGEPQSRQRQNRRQDHGYGGGIQNNTAVDEDEELRRALELSKKTAKQEEKKRLEEIKKESATEQIQPKKSQPRVKQKSGANGNADGFDFGAGFEKFATHNAN